MTGSHVQPEQLPDAGQDDDLTIIGVQEPQRLAAVARLVAGPGRGSPEQAKRFVEFSQRNGIRIDAMWASVDRAGDVVASVLAVPNPGRSAMLFASIPPNRQVVSAHARLIDHACEHLRGMEVDLVQSLLEPHDALQRQAHLDGGFHVLASLSYLERPLDAAGAAAAPRFPAGVTVEPYREALRDEVLTVLDDSYEQTRDCPGLRGLRRTEDILAGHQATGAFDADLWTLLRVEGRARGVLMLNPSPSSNAIELVYIGLARAAQGRGLGRKLLRHGLTLLAGRRERALTLAVDDDNDAAIALYRSEGFKRVLRRTALIRPLRDAKRGAENVPG
jgi:GNAT superfamily N-acetyltransferase